MISLKCDYSKKLGLPGYSSHQFSISLETELSDVSQVQAESARLYKLLQEGVDSSIRETGYLPSETRANGNGNGAHHGHNGNGNGHSNNQRQTTPDESWKCSPKQKELVLKIIEEHKLDKNQVESLAQDRFSKGVKSLNKLEASGLIEELLEQTGQSKPRNQRFGKAGAR